MVIQVDRMEKKSPKKKTAVKKVEVKKVEKPKKKKVRKKIAKVVVARGKRKTSIARATIRSGKGEIRINNSALDATQNKYIRDIIREPLTFIGPEANEIDVYVNVIGGGVMGQAQAARTAIANALIKYFDQLNLKEKFLSIDRSFVVEDVRRVESKKYKGPKARARYQKSYR